MLDAQQPLKVRLDKWLWAARFYKTRALASDAIKGGRVQVNGERAKPSRTLNTGDKLRISRAEEVLQITVMALSERRGPASVAQTLYQEDEASLNSRLQQREQRRLELASQPQHEGRPNKKQRRQIHRFRNIHDAD